MASTSLANRMSTLSVMSSLKDWRCRSTQKASDRVSATLRPESRASLAASIIASFALGASHR